jgi:ESF2/ABP1 family protein
MLNAQPIGGKKGTRWRDDVWTMKYLPKFKWSMLTEQVGACLLYCPERHYNAKQPMKQQSILRNYALSFLNLEPSSVTT